MNNKRNIVPHCAVISLILFVFAGCSKNDCPSGRPADGLAPSDGKSIAFEPDNAFTKTAVLDVADIQNDPNGFRVWSWFEGATAGPMFGKTGTQVTYSGGNWTYSPTRYWINGTYDFAAVYPAAVTTGEGDAAVTTQIIGEYKPTVPDSTPILTVPNFDVTSQADLLVAFNNGEDGTGIDGSLGNANNPVEFSFQHALSNIQLVLTLNEDDFFVDATDENNNPILDENGNKKKFPTGYAKVTIVGFNNIATLGSLEASKSTNTISCNWATSKFDNEFKFNYTAEPIQVTLTGQEVFGEHGMFVIPQSLINGKGELYMQVVIESPGITATVTKEFIVPLKTGVSEWLPNTKYVYRGEITRELIINFSVTRIVDWEDETLGDLNIQ